MAPIQNQMNAVWQERLKSALRTALACFIVGFTSLYGPEPLRSVLRYPAFSYVTTILIVSDATVGDALRGCWHVLYASLQVILPSILCLWLVGPTHFTPGLAAMAVAVSAFFVALPESTSLMSKRIAFGQIVIVYVGTVIQGAKAHVVMHPVHVVSSAALGASASVLALLLPCPRLACTEMRKACRLYTENAIERLNLYFRAFSSQDTPTAVDLISDASSFSRTGDKILQGIKHYEEGMLWERPDIRFLRHNCMNMAERLQEIELPLRGMNLALSSCSFPVGIIDQDLRNYLPSVNTEVGQKLEQAKCYAPLDGKTAPEAKGENFLKSLQTFKTIPTSYEDLPPLFFLFCLKLLQQEYPLKQSQMVMLEKNQESEKAESNDFKYQVVGKSIRAWNYLKTRFCSHNMVFAVKCSLSLGLAVLFGLVYNRKNGYWSGLTIAISFVTGRQPTFTMANARAQGTAMGSVYGIIFCFLFEKYMYIRLLPLLPWIIFTSFLRHSRMYGQAGGISAVIGALLILGRKNYGAPSEFAIARITEATIGLVCFIIVEMLFESTRAATLAKAELSLSLGKLRECIEVVAFHPIEKQMAGSILENFQERQSQLKVEISKYQTVTEEAQLEPNFWFLPFPGACYVKLQGHLSNMIDLGQFMALQIDFLSQLSRYLSFSWDEIQQLLDKDMEVFKENVLSSIKCLEDIALIKSLPKLEGELQKKKGIHDIELGKATNAITSTCLGVTEEEITKVASSYIQQSNEVALKINDHEGKEELKSHVILCLGGLGFCISKFMRETIELEETIKELIKKENPLCHVNLSEISCKLNALRT